MNDFFNKIPIVAPTPTPFTNDEVDYKKLTIPNLKKLAEERGFTNYKKLKKQGLVDLLSN